MGQPGVGWHARRATLHPSLPNRGVVRKGEFPLYPLPVTVKGRWQPLVAGHVAAPGDSTNGDSAATNLPPRHLDQDPIGSPPGSSRIPPTRLGFFPFPVLPPQEGGRG
jgi:hypothetical protein